MMTLAFALQQVLQNLQIAPGQIHDVWYYINHNVGVEGVLFPPRNVFLQTDKLQKVTEQIAVRVLIED